MMQALRSMFGSAEGPSLRKSASSARTPATATNRAVRSKNLKKKKKAAPARKSKAASPAAARARNGGGKRDDDDGDDDALSFTAGKKMKARKTARPSSSIGKMKAKKATTPRRTSRPRSPVAPPVSAPSKHYVPLATKRTKKAARKPSPAPGTLLPLPGLRLAGIGIQRAGLCTPNTEPAPVRSTRKSAAVAATAAPRSASRFSLGVGDSNVRAAVAEEAAATTIQAAWRRRLVRFASLVCWLCVAFLPGLLPTVGTVLLVWNARVRSVLLEFRHPELCAERVSSRSTKQSCPVMSSSSNRHCHHSPDRRSCRQRWVARKWMTMTGRMMVILCAWPAGAFCLHRVATLADLDR